MSGRISRYPSLKALFLAYMQEGTTKVSTYGYIHLEHEKRSFCSHSFSSFLPPTPSFCVLRPVSWEEKEGGKGQSCLGLGQARLGRLLLLLLFRLILPPEPDACGTLCTLAFFFYKGKGGKSRS